MMKKTYIHPEMEIVKIETQQVIATSSLGMGSGTQPPSGADSRLFEDFDVFGAFNDMNDLQDLFKE